MDWSLWQHAHVQKNMDTHNTLRYLGVPLREKCFMFGNNESVVNIASILHAKLHKHHIELSFRRVKEAIMVGVMSFIV